MSYTNLRPTVNEQKTAWVNSLIAPIATQHGGTLECVVREWVFEVGQSAATCTPTTKHAYIKRLIAKSLCGQLIEKEIADIELYERSVHFHLVDFPRGAFAKAHNKIFDLLKQVGFDKVILDDYTRAGYDVWGKYGFSGNYLSNTRVKVL